MSGKPACEELQKKLTKLERKICDQQQVQQRLEESNIEMLDMLESISDGFFSLDDDYVLTYFNRAAEKVLGRKSWEVLGRRLFEAFPEMKGSIFETRFEQTLKEQIPISFETYFPVKPYENWYEVRIYPRKSGLSVFFQVTTEHHRIAEATRKLEAQLRQAEKLRATAKLAGGIANDFNNLLSVIQSSASLLLFNLESTHPHYPTLKDIEKQARDGSRLSAQLLGYSRKGRYSVTPFDLNELVKETLKTFVEEKNGAQGTILLVDDDDSILDVGGTMLRRLGYGVIKAKGGMEAIRFFEEEGEHICLVILDMIMPDMDGGEVFKKVVGMNDGIRVLLSTGTSPDGQVRDILKKGGAGFIQKPFGIQELSEKIAEVLGKPECC